jgi:hypothetical protein
LLCLLTHDKEEESEFRAPPLFCGCDLKHVGTICSYLTGCRQPIASGSCTIAHLRFECVMLFHDSALSARSGIKFLGCLTLFFGFTMIVPAQDDRPPQILEIYRDYLKPDSVAKNRKLERRAEHLCRTLGFSHPYLTIESVSGPAEMWYLNGFDSQAEVEQLGHSYQRNAPLVAALDAIVARKAPLKRADSTNEFARYRPDLSRGNPWILGRGRFLVIAFFAADSPLDGTVFEMENGQRMVIRGAQTSAQANALLGSAGPKANVFQTYSYFRPRQR